MRNLGLALIGLVLVVAPAWAQSASDTSSEGKTTFDGTDSGTAEGQPGKTATMAELLQDGYEIKSSVPSGTDKLIIFMQNEKSAYACEFTNVENTQCGSIN